MLSSANRVNVANLLYLPCTTLFEFELNVATHLRLNMASVMYQFDVAFRMRQNEFKRAKRTGSSPIRSLQLKRTE